MSLIGFRQKGPNSGEKFANLTQQDLCDRCPAAGAVVIQLPSKRCLVMCRHHYLHHQVALATEGAAVYWKPGVTP